VEETMRSSILAAAACGLFAFPALTGAAQAQQKELTFWSHWAAEMPKRTFVEAAIKAFEEKNPGVKIKQTR
jgi:ABC-type glycerol-3-phosphate transport system substrate-binding protein